jgi:6-phosphogluconolactonase
LNIFGNNFPVFDLIVLGLGPDGHTASLFPGDDQALRNKSLFISTNAPTPFDVKERITMNLSLINNAALRLFIISGKGKAEMIQRILQRDDSIPAAKVNSDSTIYFDNHI